MITKLIPAAAIAMFAIASPALADDDDLCRTGNAGTWMSVTDIVAKAEGAGYKVREVERDDGCYEIKGTGGDGQRVEVKMHPATGEVVRVRNDD